MPVADFAQGVTSSNYWAAHLNSLKPQSTASATASTDTSTGKPLITTGADGKSFFDNVLDIVNPLEHLPIVSTIYHAITGNQSGDLEKMAGDTLYGGPIGLVSSVADIAFEKITGKSFGDTMLSMVGLDGDASSGNTALAANTAKTNDAEAATTAALNKASLAPVAKMAQATSPLLSMTSPMAPIASAAPVQLAKPAPTTTVAQAAVDISPQTDALLQSLQRNGVTGPMQAQALDAYRRSMSLKPSFVN